MNVHRFAFALAVGGIVWAGPQLTAQTAGQRSQPIVLGVYFDEGHKPFEPFDAELRRSCPCVDRALALIPRVVSFSDYSHTATRPLRPRREFVDVIREFVDRQINDAFIVQERGLLLARTLIAGRGRTREEAGAAILAAVPLYRRLARRGDVLAQQDLAYLFSVGLGVPQNESAAAYWYGRAALQGSDEARLALAAMYVLGRGVPRDEAAAASWILQSRNEQLKGDVYACGLGVPQDLERAREVYAAAATSSVDAQYQLGTMHANACGAPLDDRAAHQLFERAARAGHPEAQIALSEMETSGLARGIRAPDMGYYWATLAVLRLPEGSPSRRRAIAARDRAMAVASREQREDARWLVRAMLEAERKARGEELKDFRSAALGQTRTRP